MSHSNPTDTGGLSSGALLTAFRLQYHRFDRSIHEILAAPTDSVVLARLGDDVDEYSVIVNEVHQVNLLLNRIQVLILYRMHIILSLQSFRPFGPISLSCNRTFGFSTSRLWQNLIMEGQQLLKTSILENEVDQGFTLILISCDGHMVTAAPVVLPDFSMWTAR
jgi:hypothetical protein